MFSVSQNRKHNNTSKHWCTAVDKYHSICISHDLIMERHVTGKCNQCTKTQAESEKHLSSCILPDIGILQQFPLQCNYTAMLSLFFFFHIWLRGSNVALVWCGWAGFVIPQGKGRRPKEGVGLLSLLVAVLRYTFGSGTKKRKWQESTCMWLKPLIGWENLKFYSS